MVSLFNMSCSKCNCRTVKRLISKRKKINFAIAVGINTILGIIFIVPLAFVPFTAAIFGLLMLVPDKKEEYILFECKTCGEKIKIENLNNKNNNKKNKTTKTI